MLRYLAVGAICGLVLGAFAETAILPLREIHLPVPSSRGSYSHFPYAEAARGHFAMRPALDHSILIFDADASGKWPLVRMKEWWTEAPASEVLNIPGWSAADSKHLEALRVDVQVTPDGRYAVTFAEAIWMARSSFLLHAPKDYVERNPDTIITVIDLERWQIVTSLHTMAGGHGDVSAARVVDNQWIALDASLGSSGAEQGADRYRNWMLSIPELRPGPECVSERFSHIGSPPIDLAAERVDQKNTEACRDVFMAAGTDSDIGLEALIRRGSGVEPKTMRLRDVEWREQSLEAERNPVWRSDQGRLWDADGDSDQFFRHWGEWPYYDIYAYNPPFESSSHLWYGLYDSHEKQFYELDRYDAEGHQQRSQIERQSLCGDPTLGRLKSACGCKVVDVSEESNKLLTYCRQQRGDFAGAVQRQWLSVFRADDLSTLGLINLSAGEEALQAIATDRRETYVVTLEFGEVLRVYAVPDHPN